MTDVDCAYLAGLMDSRCYLGARYRRAGILQPEMEICRELPVLEKVRMIIGVGTIQRYKKGWRYRLRGPRVKLVLEQVGEMMHGEARWALQEFQQK